MPKNSLAVLLITPPMTQMNSPYPATAYLAAHLRSLGHQVTQMDLGLEVFLRLFSRRGLDLIKLEIETLSKEKSLEKPLIKNSEPHPSVGFFLEAFDQYSNAIDAVVSFLQGKNPSLAWRITNHSLLPEGPRFFANSEHQDHIDQLFGNLGLQDKAKHLASLFLDDLADAIKFGIDPDFEFSRYGEKLASSQPDYSVVLARLNQPRLVDRIIHQILSEEFSNQQFDLVGFTVPFAGNLLGALSASRWFKTHQPNCSIVLGGGFVNTELRRLSDTRIFQEIDYLVYDDGELPLERILQSKLNQESSAQQNPTTQLIRTSHLDKDSQLNHGLKAQGLQSQGHKETHSFKKILAPDYRGLPLDRYISLLEMPNPAHRLWSDLRWNKMILAHGCYWKRCSFCDVNLDYIGRFEPKTASQIADHIEEVIAATGTSGFHFVDEAAPPALLKELSNEIIRRQLKITWWGNLRFDQQYTQELTQLMAEAGCVAVTGGLEVASPRILQLINKGISIDQVALVTKNFKEAGILVHAYLMYGFPSQTVQETVDSLEIVRQLFDNGCLTSAHWHRFVLTAHSPIAQNPLKYGIMTQPPSNPEKGLFAEYEIPHHDFVTTPNDELGEGLRMALYNYMHGIGIKSAVNHWFRIKTPKTTVQKNHISGVLRTPMNQMKKSHALTSDHNLSNS